MPNNPQFNNQTGDNNLRFAKPNHNPKLLTLILKSIIMLLVISFFFVFLGIAALAVLHLFLLRRPRRRPERLVSLPGFVYLGDQGEDCAVCLDGLREGDVCRRLPACRHVFHARCVDRWLAKVLNCPICRTGVEVEVLEGGSGCEEDEAKVLWSI